MNEKAQVMQPQTKVLPAPVREVTLAIPDWVDELVDWSRAYGSDDEKMALAVELSRQNVRRGSGGPFGTVIFDMDSGLPVGVGVNGVVRSANSTFHGEISAIMMAERRIGSFTLGADDLACELFTSCEPCAMCLGAILWSGVKRLVCGATGDDAREIGFDEGPVFPESFAYLERSGIEIVREVRRREARQVLECYVREGGAIYNG